MIYWNQIHFTSRRRYIKMYFIHMCTILPKLFDLNQIGWNREKCILSVFCWLFVSNNCCWFGLFCCCCCLWSFLHFVALFCWPPSSERFLIVHLEGEKMIKYLMKKLFFFSCVSLTSLVDPRKLRNNSEVDHYNDEQLDTFCDSLSFQ